jgi:hypothetical protein
MGLSGVEKDALQGVFGFGEFVFQVSYQARRGAHIAGLYLFDLFCFFRVIGHGCFTPERNLICLPPVGSLLRRSC